MQGQQKSLTSNLKGMLKYRPMLNNLFVTTRADHSFSLSQVNHFVKKNVISVVRFKKCNLPSSYLSIAA